MFFAKGPRVATAIILAAIACVASVVRADAPYTAVDLYSLVPPAGYAYAEPMDSANALHPMQGGQFVDFQDSLSVPNANQGLLWSSAGVPTQMTPTNLSGYSVSDVIGAGGSQQVGWSGGTATGLTPINPSLYHAMVWNGSANTAVDLHPTALTGFTSSVAIATDGAHQAGYAMTGSNNVSHAMAWSGTAVSAMDLNPTQFANYYESIACGVSGNQQVGKMIGLSRLQLPDEALLWSGTAASAVNLDPIQIESAGGSGSRGSVAYGIGGGKQVGSAATLTGTHAILWSGTAASAVDLNPVGSAMSEAYSTNGTWQVGYTGILTGSQPPYLPNAMVWKGTAGSAVNLESLLPSNFGLSSAYDVNSAGDVFGIADDKSGIYHAIEWVAAPHSATGSVSGGANQTASVAGRGDTFGQVDFKFSTASAGTLTNVSKLVTSADLAASTAAFNFALPTTNGLIQAWNLSFTGTFTAPATLTFHYDPSDLQAGIDPAQLQIEHFTNGQWVALSGVVDPVADTITANTDSFSPFALSVVPEPSSAVGMLVLCTAAGLRRSRRSVTNR